MNVKLGKNYRLKASDMATTPTFTQIAGEQALNYKTSTDKLDTSSKDDGPIKSVAAGQSERMISVSGVANLPDIGIANINTAYEAGTPLNCQIIDNSNGTPVTKFAGSFYVFNLSMDLTNNQPGKYSFDLQLNGPASTSALFT